MFRASMSVGSRFLLMGTRRATSLSSTPIAFRHNPIPSVVGASFSSGSSAGDDMTYCGAGAGFIRQGICDTDMKNPLQTWGQKGAYEFKKVDEGLFLRMEMPGIDKDGLKISFDGDAVCVKGQCKKEIYEEKGREYNVRIKIPSHEFKINQKMEAEMNNYVLALEIPMYKTIKVQAEMKNGVFESVEIEGNKENLEGKKEAIHDNSGPNVCVEENKADIHDKSGPSDSPKIQKLHAEIHEMLKDSGYKSTHKSKDFVRPTKDGVGKKEVENNASNLKDCVFQLEDVLDKYGKDSQASSSKNKESIHDDTCPNVQVDEKKEAANDKRSPSDSLSIKNMDSEVREKMLNDFRSELKLGQKFIHEFENFVRLLPDNEAKKEVEGFLCKLKDLVGKLEVVVARQTQEMLNEFRNELNPGHKLIHEFEGSVCSLIHEFKDNKAKKKVWGFLREVKDLVGKLDNVLDKYEKVCQNLSSKKMKGLKRRWWPFRG